MFVVKFIFEISQWQERQRKACYFHGFTQPKQPPIFDYDQSLSAFWENQMITGSLRYVFGIPQRIIMYRGWGTADWWI